MFTELGPSCSVHLPPQTASPAGGSGQPSPAVPQRPDFKEAARVDFDPLHPVPPFHIWRPAFKRQVANSSAFPMEAYQWISEVETATCIEDLANLGRFETLDAKIASGLTSICHGEFLRRINVLEEQLDSKRQMLAGRQIAYLIYERFKLPTEDGAIFEFEDLLQVELRGDNLRAFQNDWEFVLSG